MKKTMITPLPDSSSGTSPEETPEFTGTTETGSKKEPKTKTQTTGDSLKGAKKLNGKPPRPGKTLMTCH